METKIESYTDKIYKAKQLLKAKEDNLYYDLAKKLDNASLDLSNLEMTFHIHSRDGDIFFNDSTVIKNALMKLLVQNNYPVKSLNLTQDSNLITIVVCLNPLV